MKIPAFVSALRTLLAILGHEQRQLAWVVLLMIGVGVLEFLSIGSLFPLLTLMIDPAAARGGLWEQFPSLSRASERDVMALAIAVLLLFIGKAAFTAWALGKGFRFSYGVQVAVGQRMLRAQLERNYEQHLRSNPAVSLKDVTTEVHLFASNVLNPAVILLSQVIIVSFLFALLAMTSTIVAALLLLTVGGTSGIIYLVSQRRVLEWGRLRETRLAQMHRVAHEALTGYKIVKVHGAEDAFVHAYGNIGVQYAALNARYQTAAAVPPLLLELFMFGGFTAVVFFSATTAGGFLATLPSLGLVCAAGFRMLPAARRIFANVGMVRYYWGSVEVIASQLHDHSEAERARESVVSSSHTRVVTDGIVCDDIHYTYPDGNQVLCGTSFAIPRGAKIAVVGTSGAGKSTLLDVLLGLLAPQRGTVWIDGIALDNETRAAWLEQVGYVSQHIVLLDATVRESVAFGEEEIDDARVEQALRKAQLWDFVCALPAGFDSQIGENGVRLSGGERQRLAVARALYRTPRVLILDEPTSAVDTVTEASIVRDVLEECGDLTVIIVAHRLATVRRCERVLLLADGVIRAAGAYDELLRVSPTFARMARSNVAAPHEGPLLRA